MCYASPDGKQEGRWDIFVTQLSLSYLALCEMAQKDH